MSSAAASSLFFLLVRVRIISLSESVSYFSLFLLPINSFPFPPLVQFVTVKSVFYVDYLFPNIYDEIMKASDILLNGRPFSGIWVASARKYLGMIFAPHSCCFIGVSFFVYVFLVHRRVITVWKYRLRWPCSWWKGLLRLVNLHKYTKTSTIYSHADWAKTICSHNWKSLFLFFSFLFFLGVGGGGFR